MKAKLSGFMDDELESHEEQPLFDAVRRDVALRRYWQDCQVIGDALRDEPALEVDIAARVMTALRDEPVVLAPRAATRPGWQKTALALAATVAGVAAVGWVALGPQQNGDVATVASVPNRMLALQDPVAEMQPVRMAGRDMQEYLIAHQAQSSALQFRGGAEHIRTVAANGAVPVK
jgi:sigma-E factor negative regulatory protein RseA